MVVKGWKYYNHAAVPTTAPHEQPVMAPVADNSIWNMDGKGVPLLARWTTDFDCGSETNWWYVIKDTPFDISALKAKRRYEINKGNKNFDIREIQPSEYKEEIYAIVAAAWATYPAKYRPALDRAGFMAQIDHWQYYKAYGAFLKEDQKLCAYALLKRDDTYIDFCVLKAMPEYESLSVNAAIIYKILEDHAAFLESGGYICDGARSISHETAFQDYLEKYFCFRKAYCRLHVQYNPKIRWLIKWLYPARRILAKWDHIDKVYQLTAVLKMEELARHSGTENRL